MNKTSSRGKCCHSLVCVKQHLKPGWADHQFPSHHPLRLERGPAAHKSMRSGRRVRYLHPQEWRNHLKKKNNKLMLCCFVQCSFLLTWTFRFLAGKLITVTATATYHKWIRSEVPSYTIKSKPHGGMCARAEEGLGAFSKEQASPAPLHHYATKNKLGEEKENSLKCERRESKLVVDFFKLI